MSEKKMYMQPQELYAAIQEAQELGYPTVKMCEMFRTIATNMLRGARFHGYSKELKEDMQSAALEKCIRSYHNVTPDKADNCFAYMTLACQCAFYSVLKRHYRHENLVREIRDMQLDQLALIDPIGAAKMRDYAK